MTVPWTYFLMLNFQQLKRHSLKLANAADKIYKIVSRKSNFQDIFNVQTAQPVTSALI